jgi:hypothetical protein
MRWAREVRRLCGLQNMYAFRESIIFLCRRVNGWLVIFGDAAAVRSAADCTRKIVERKLKKDCI